MKIVSIRRKGRSNKVVVELDDGRALELPREVAIAAGMRKGEEVDEAALLRVERRAEQWRCKEAGLRLLTYRPRSERELRTRLRQKNFAADIVDDCVVDLERAGLIDDQEFARLAARDRLRSRPMGRRMLEAELRARGVEAKHASAAADAAIDDGEGDESDLALRAARKFRHRDGEDPASTRRRFYAFLARRGFDSETIRAAMDRVLDPES